MTKVEFVEKYAEKTGMSKKDAAAAVKAFFEVTADALKAGDKEHSKQRLPREQREQAAIRSQAQRW